MFNEDVAVSKLSELFALSLGHPPEYARQIKAAAALHDIGKMRIPDSILNKPSKLTPMEYTIMKSHTKIGAEMLSSIQGDLGVMVRTVCEFHHEHHSGDGYWGIPTSQLPDYIPIISIADVFVACYSKRPYKDSWPCEQVLEYLQSLSGTQFSVDTVDAFVHLIRNDPGVASIIALLNRKELTPCE